MKKFGALVALVSFLFFSFSAAALPAAGTGGMVASAHAEATHAGVEMLRQGGNAADAAVATAFALAVAEPYASGIGGGGFALVRMGGELVFLDFREVAPAAANRDMYLRDGRPIPELSTDGPLAVAVPGAVAGYLELHARWGKLPRAKVLEPAIRLAHEGVVIDERYRGYARHRLPVLRADPEAARIFLHDGEVPPLGWKLKQPELARTLEILAESGPAPFYEGEIATAIAADLARRGGILTEADLSAYRVRERKPLVGTYLGHAVATAPLPSSGGMIVLSVLNALESLPPQTPWRDPVALHLYIEAAKRAFADRRLLADPAFVDVPVDRLVSKERARNWVEEIGFLATPPEAIAPGGAESPREGAHTSHLSVVDREGNAIALTTTINTPFGAGIVARGTGILLNNEMDDFAAAPGVPNAYGIVGSEANAIAPGKVPLSSMAPTLVFSGPTTDSPVRLVVGSPGGSRIPTTVVQVIFHHLFHGMPIDQAIAQGRIHQQHLPEVVYVEPYALDAATAGLLMLRGHKLVETGPWSNATAIAIDPETGIRTGAADPRGVGMAMAE
nr:MAG: gamma-glutamyltransferase [Pseudomonadota bacterium]